MIDGLALFSEGLFKATLDRGKVNNLDAIPAIEIEIKEIDLFIKALQKKYGITVDTPKKMAEMIYGVAIFSGALFEATLERNGGEGSNIEKTFNDQVHKITSFLGDLENKHQELKKTNSAEQTMIKAVQWIDQKDTELVPETSRA